MAGFPDQVRASLPVLMTIIITWLLTMRLTPYPLHVPTIVAPIPEVGGSLPEAILDPAPYFNALTVIAVMAAGGVILVVVLLKRVRVLKVFGASLTAVTAFATTSYYLLTSTSISPGVALALAVLAATWVVVSILGLRGIHLIMASAYVGASAGAVISSMIPFWTTIILMLAVSGYDILAVYVGHLRVLGNLEGVSIPGLMVDYDGLSIGMGDLFFYSLIQSFSLSRIGLFPGLMTTLGLYIGFIITVQLAVRRRFVAGLPIPITLSMGLAFAGTLISQ
ncbi:MAG: hypothetical protein QW756_06520 [Nitrososphaerota archaeon]